MGHGSTNRTFTTKFNLKGLYDGKMPEFFWPSYYGLDNKQLTMDTLHTATYRGTHKCIFHSPPPAPKKPEKEPLIIDKTVHARCGYWGDSPGAMCTGFSVKSAPKSLGFCFHPGYDGPPPAGGAARIINVTESINMGFVPEVGKWYDWTLVFRKTGIHSWQIQSTPDSTDEDGTQKDSEGSGDGKGEGGKLAKTMEATKAGIKGAFAKEGENMVLGKCGSNCGGSELHFPMQCESASRITLTAEAAAPDGQDTVTLQMGEKDGKGKVSASGSKHKWTLGPSSEIKMSKTTTFSLDVDSGATVLILAGDGEGVQIKSLTVKTSEPGDCKFKVPDKDGETEQEEDEEGDGETGTGRQ
jgi:hypothetical protein